MRTREIERGDFFMSHRQIAKILGLEVEQVKTIERAAIRKLRRSTRMQVLNNERD